MSDQHDRVESGCPYPGLRPFSREDSDFFFGREEHIDELLQKLEVNRFVAVVGASGCGKSSLVRAGLLPMLEHGFMAEAGPNWRMATLRPGNAPFEQLSEALLAPEALGPERQNAPHAAAMLEATLRRGRLGLIEAMRETLLPEGTNLLVLVDQFEEIFRYREQSSANEAEAFVDLLLAAAQHQSKPRGGGQVAPVYVLITMRSDFIGDCALFLGLPEAINQSQFLTPRLDREQCRAAIAGPARALGGDIQAPLVAELLNNLRADADHLPLLQHLLMRMWRTAVASGRETPSLGIEDLSDAGGMDGALSDHADEAFNELMPPQRRTAEAMFRALCDVGAEGRGIRRLVSLREIAAIGDTSIEEVQAVAEAFRHPDRSFLMPPVGTPLEAETILDISHESLIRQWSRLTNWAADEAASSRTYRRLRLTARLWDAGEAALWRTPDLEIAESWRQQQQPSEAWADRYGGGYKQSMAFLDASVARRERRQRNRRLQLVGAFASLTAVAAWLAMATYQASMARAQEEDAKNRAVAAAESESQAKQEAILEREKAVEARAEAERARRVAEDARRRNAYNFGFTGILDEWRDALAGQSDDAFRQRLDEFDPEFREFSWRLCRSLADSRGVQAMSMPPGPAQGAAFRALCIAPLKATGTYVVGGSGGHVAIASTNSGEGASAFWTAPNESDVLAICTSPDKQSVALATADGVVRILSLDNAGEPRVIVSEAPATRALAFSPDGSKLATGGLDNVVRVWDLQRGAVLGEFKGHTDWVSSVAFSPSGARLASASYDRTIRLWDSDNAESSKELSGFEGPVTSIAFTPDGEKLVSGSDDNTLRLWNARSAMLLDTASSHTSFVSTVGVSPDGAVIASADVGGQLRLWRLLGDQLREEHGPQRRHAGAINAVAFGQGKELVTAGDDGEVLLWNADTGARLDSPRLELRAHDAVDATCSVSSGVLATLSTQGAVEVWWHGQPQTVALPKTDDDQNRRATAISIDPSRGLLAVGDASGALMLVDEDGQVLSLVDSPVIGDRPVGSVSAIRFHPDGRWLCSATTHGRIDLWRVEQGKPEWLRGWRRHRGVVHSLDFAPHDESATASGPTLASGGEDGSVRVWNLHRLLSEPGATIADCEHVVVRADTGANLHAEAVNKVRFSPASLAPTLASGSSDGTVALCQWESWPAMLHNAPAIQNLRGHQGEVTSICISADGQTMASAGLDGTVRLWDPVTGHLRLTLTDHATAVREVTWTTVDGNRAGGNEALAALADDGHLKFWVAATEADSNSPTKVRQAQASKTAR